MRNKKFLSEQKKRTPEEQDKAALNLKKELHKTFFKAYDNKNLSIMSNIRKRSPKTYAAMKKRMFENF